LIMARTIGAKTDQKRTVAFRGSEIVAKIKLLPPSSHAVVPAV
jgi:hypothetical protein